jgi:hypothetical protein
MTAADKHTRHQHLTAVAAADHAVGGAHWLLAALAATGWRAEVPARRIIGRRTCGAAPALIARRGDRPLVLVELEPGSDFPLHGERRTLYLRCRAAGSGVMVLLTDASWTRRVWLWESAIYPTVVREAREPVGPGAAVEMVAMILREAPAPTPQPCVRSAAASIHARLATRLRMTAGEAAGTGVGAAVRAKMIRLTHAAETPAAALAMWSALRGLRLMDPECGEGHWLLDAVSTLEPLYAATLQQMAGFYLDCGTVRESRSLPRGLRMAVGGAGGSAIPDVRPYLRLTILLHNLAGSSSDRAALRIARLRLARALASDSEEENRVIRRVLRQRVVAVEPRRCRMAAGGAADSARQDREAALLGRAYTVIRDLHLTRRAPARDLLAGYRSLERRIGALVESCDGEAGLRLRIPGHHGQLVTPEEA